MRIHNQQKPEVPKNEAAEQACVSIMMQNYETLDRAKWEDDLFLSEKNKLIIAACKEAHALGRKAGYFALEAHFEGKGALAEVGWRDGLFSAFTHYPAPDIEIALHFRKDLVKARRYRRALQAADGMRQDIATMQADLTQLADLATEDEEIEAAPTMKQQCEAFLDQLESTEVPESFRTGIAHLDSLLGGGFRRGRVAVFASETSGGKSIALIQAAIEAASDAKRGVIFSMEMSSMDIISRMTAYIAQHPIIPRTAGPKRDALNAWGVAVKRISKFPVVIHDQISGIDEIERIVRMEAKAGLDFVVVDYLQLCQSPDESKAETREQQVSEVMRRLKLLALSQNVLVMTASQLNDKGELRESRAIGHHADYVLHIDHSGEDGSYVRLMKNRNGERFVAAPILMRGALSQLAERDVKK